MSEGNDPVFECGCCGGVLPRASLGAYVGAGDLAAVCLPCYGAYTSIGAEDPDQTVTERLDRVRLWRALEMLSAREKRKLKKLDLLIRNHSVRAERLSGMAAAGSISFRQLLAII